MFKKVLFSLLAAVFTLTLAGCATSACKNKNLEIQGLKNQVIVLEAQVQSKDEELNSLKDSLNKSVEQPKVETVEPVKEKPVTNIKHLSARDIQTALKNAGYDPGKIDGHMGKQTREAVKAFQKANNLTVNGKVNKKTWALLSGYLNQQAK